MPRRPDSPPASPHPASSPVLAAVLRWTRIGSRTPTVRHVAILMLLRESGPRRVYEIAADLGCSKESVDYTLGRLADHGLVRSWTEGVGDGARALAELTAVGHSYLGGVM